MKSNTKPWFDIGVLSAVQNHNKHYKNFEQSGKKIDKDGVSFNSKKNANIVLLFSRTCRLIIPKTSTSKKLICNQNH